jgi:hypothetical protein
MGALEKGDELFYSEEAKGRTERQKEVYTVVVACGCVMVSEVLDYATKYGVYAASPIGQERDGHPRKSG